jgi:hypothetical protein
MSVGFLLQLLGTLALVGGVVLGLAQVRHMGKARKSASAIELVHSFQTPEFARGLVLVYSLPDGLTKAEVLEQLGNEGHLVYSLVTVWESLGILVYRGELDLDTVADFFSGCIVVSWRKMQQYVRDERADTNRETMGEWFQWLNDRLLAAESATPAVPAYIEHRDWQPPHRR